MAKENLTPTKLFKLFFDEALLRFIIDERSDPIETVDFFIEEFKDDENLVKLFWDAMNYLPDFLNHATPITKHLFEKEQIELEMPTELISYDLTTESKSEFCLPWIMFSALKPAMKLTYLRSLTDWFTAEGKYPEFPTLPLD